MSPTHKHEPGAKAPDGDSLAADLVHVERLLRRRRAMSLLASAAGTGLLLAGGGALAAPRGNRPGANGASSSSSTSGAGGTGSTCTACATETAGPYPADGTNASSGATSDVLTASGSMTPTLTGSVAAGYTGTATVGLAR